MEKIFAPEQNRELIRGWLAVRGESLDSCAQ
jgi:hypothetical protein